MTFDYTIDDKAEVISLRISGSVSAGEFIAGIKRLWADPAYNRDYVGIADLTGTIDSYKLDELKTVTAFVRNQEQASRARWAVVATSPLAVACVLIYQRAMASVHGLAVFSTMDAARHFLRLDFPTANAESPII